jgi:acetoin utilization deacetylase AcuC-like enzyme
MITFYSPQHALHHGKLEMFRGELVPCFEVPARADFVLQELMRRGLGLVQQPPVTSTPGPPSSPMTSLEAAHHPVGASALAAIHTPRYLDFLAHAWDEWVALDPANAAKDAFPSLWPVRSFRTDVLPANFSARMGLFSFDAGSPITSGTWAAARAGADCAVMAAQHVSSGNRAAFALTRPPGHHAGADFFGGYCFLNNAALAAQHLRNSGLQRVAVLDIDYHHGNGTQAIFYDRPDVLFASIHGDPHTEYPFYLGYSDEVGGGAGYGFNLNLPLPRGTDFAQWRAALARAVQRISTFGAEALVVSLGLDTFEGDPISGFKLRSDDYFRVGEELARAGLPTVFVFEGGYAVAELGVNAVNVLEGFEQAAA